jgi:hypothetical protein
MTDDAVRYVRSGDGQCAAAIVTVHEFSSRRSNSLVPLGRVGHRDAIEETWGRPKADEAFAAGEPRICE